MSAVTIDLDAARAARAEAQGDGPVLVVGGKQYTLGVEMPFGVLEAFYNMSDPTKAAGAMAQLAQAILGEHYEEIAAQRLSVDDVTELLQGAMTAYGVADPLPSPVS